MHAADQRGPARARGKIEPRDGELLADEGINGIGGAGFRPSLPWDERTLNRPEAPKLAVFLSEVKAARKFGRFRTPRLGAARDPTLDDGDLFSGERLASLRHLASSDFLQHHAPLGLARDKDFARFRVCEHEPSEPKIDTALGLFGLAMAMETVGLQDRPHVTFEGQRRLRCRVGPERKSHSTDQRQFKIVAVRH
jgi:hypothetical protein